MKDPDRRLSELDALSRERFPHFVQVARAIVADRDRAMEVVQEAFVGTIRSRDRFRDEGPLEAWVWRAVVNAARDAVRRPMVEAGSEPNDAFLAPEPDIELLVTTSGAYSFVGGERPRSERRRAAPGAPA